MRVSAMCPGCHHVNDAGARTCELCGRGVTFTNQTAREPVPGRYARPGAHGAPARRVDPDRVARA